MAAFGAGNLEDLAEVEVAVDALKRSGAGCLRAG